MPRLPLETAIRIHTGNDFQGTTGGFSLNQESGPPSSFEGLAEDSVL